MSISPKVCPCDVIAMIQTVDVQQASAASIFSEALNVTEKACRLYLVATYADLMSPETHRAVVSEFYNSVATYGRLLNDDTRLRIRAAYLRLPYNRTQAMLYFSGLRHGRIDIRDTLNGVIPTAKPFVHPSDDAAEGWHYLLYLASFGTAETFNSLAEGLAQIEDANLVLTLLRGINELPDPRASDILESYAEDMRQADGVNGPGIHLAEAIKNMLAYRS